MINQTNLTKGSKLTERAIGYIDLCQPWIVRSSDKIIDTKFTTLKEAQQFKDKLPASHLFEVTNCDLKIAKQLKEGFEAGDLYRILIPEVSIDYYVSNTKGAIVVAFFIKGAVPTVGPFILFCQTDPNVILVDVSPSETKEDTTIVYVEFKRNKKTVKAINLLMTEIAVLCDMALDDFVISSSHFSEKKPFDINIVREILNVQNGDES